MPAFVLNELPNFIQHDPITTARVSVPTSMVNPDLLPAHEVHMFFPVNASKVELCIAQALEHITFHPNTRLNNKFNIHLMRVNGLEIYWCHFPAEFRQVCERAAQLFKTTISDMSRALTTSHTILRLPRSEKIIIIRPSPLPCTELDRRAEEAVAFGHSLQSPRFGVD